jgi:CRISPR-associated endonuclease/helicase Cas3
MRRVAGSIRKRSRVDSGEASVEKRHGSTEANSTMTSSTEHLNWLRSALGLAQHESPFPWQVALLERLSSEAIPAALDIPTGLGKTAVMAIWLVARACGAPLPRRLVYVVDRRAVVDQATTVAERLRAWVDRELDVRRALALSGPLPISTLRGQHIDNRAWLEDPSLPAIVLGTVDMIGSRLLFEGYGVSRKMRPYHAGLLGSDTLIVLDEAHLVPPFERLVEQIACGVDAKGRTLGPTDAALKPLVPPLRVLSLSATGRARQADEVFRLTVDDDEHPVVKQRLSASKRLRLWEEVASTDLPEHLAAHAWEQAGKGTMPARIIVFCTSRDHAQKVREALEKLAGRHAVIDTELFVGGRRVHEREETARWLAERGFVAGSSGKPEHPAFVIATAAGEVGVDLDADHAVCDLVAWERMVQRLGRVNRRGDGDADVCVVPASIDDDKQLAHKLRLAAVRELLQALPRIGNDAFDASPASLTALKHKPELAALVEQASTPAPLHPPLTRALIEAWGMTSLEEHTGRPEVAPWIRGWPDEEEEPQTTVVWRTHLPITDDGQIFSRQDLERFREAADPHLSERLETETWRVLDWLSKRVDSLQPPSAEEAGLWRSQRPLRSTDVVAIILDTPSGKHVALSASDFADKRRRDNIDRALRHATLIVDCRLGGLAGGLLKNDADEAARDVTEIDVDVQAEGAQRIVPFRVRRVTDADDAAATEGWRTEASIALRRSDEGETAWLVIESLTGELAESEDGRSGARRAQLLDEHESWAEAAARRMADALSLPPEYAEMLAVGARLHDEGKKAERWQSAFKAPGGGQPPYAKTTSRPNLELLRGYRHELGSLPYAEAHERVQALPPALRELCLHLIAAHHGNARPLIRTDSAPEPPSRLADRAREVALRFSALEKAWGPWGLAWWEALLRAADQQASRRNDEQGGANG